MPLKLSRLTAALAVRTFSHSNYDTVLVRLCHVEYIVQLLDRTYTLATFGYDRFSQAISDSTRLLEPLMVKERILQTPFPTDFVSSVLNTNDIELRDICDWCGWERGDGIRLLSFLVRKHAWKRAERNTYRKTPEFIQFLKELNPKDRPAWIGEADDDM